MEIIIVIAKLTRKQTMKCERNVLCVLFDVGERQFITRLQAGGAPPPAQVWCFDDLYHPSNTSQHHTPNEQVHWEGAPFIRPVCSTVN